MEIISSTILAIIQSILFYGKEIGISMLIFSIIGNGLISYILIRKNKIKNKKGFFLIIPIILLSSTYFIFANTTFYIANIFIIIILNLTMYAIAITPKNYLRGYIVNSFELLKNTITGCKEGIDYTKEKSKENIKIKNKIEKENVKKIAISLLIVFAVVGVVIGLLISADSIFANIFENIANVFKNINISSTLRFVIRLVLIVVAYILILSFILKLNKEYNYQAKELKTNNNKYAFTIKLLLIALNIVYLVFCFIQIESLFAKINIDTDFNYASYARTGFFQLMFVSFINFAVILLSNKFNENKEKSIKILNLFLVIFTIIIAISSMYRMYMYQMEFGLTYLRMFVYIILITEILTFVPVTIYIVYEKFDFMKCSFVIWICIYCAINFINIERIIVDTNVNRTSSTRGIDYEYICSIASEDSFDILEAELQKDNLNALDELRLTKTLLTLANESKEMDWQEFNRAKWRVNEKNIKIDLLEKEIRDLDDDAKEEELRQRREAEEEAERAREEEKSSRLAKEKLAISEDSIKCVYKNIISENEAYVVEVTGYSTGTEQWTIGKITDNGTKYKEMNSFAIAPTSEIEFFEGGLGFLEKSDSIYSASSDLLVTRDSGETFDKIEFPEGEFTLSNPEGKAWEECYDYFYLPTREEDGTLTVLASGGYEGGYNGGETRAKYVSKDDGYTWEFVGEVWKE